MSERHRRVFERTHGDLFTGNRYSATFYNISQGTRSNLDDTYSGESRDAIGTIQVEMVPPAMDTTVETEGTSFSWDTSIRFPESAETPSGWGTNWGSNWGGETLVDVLTPLGVDNRKPTEVEISDEVNNTTEVYELHGYSTEKGSGMVMCRLVEQ